MALRIEANAEPIPGYRLIDRLGSGGFGEVWKAEVPGGLFKAIKFVQRYPVGDSESALGSNEDNSRADQEWKSLGRVKSVRHPFILLLDRYENIDNYLVIVMELADRTLADRFKECRSQGLPGIPRDEMLGYMAEAAEVLDLMNSQYQLQHLDIKPQNLFLVHNHIKVADFGLVKDTTFGVKLMTITGGVTPVYAAPETFDGKFSRQSDQYSLAIVYQEMLTGFRPFTGTSMKQLILQHLQNAYDLAPAPISDRPAMVRALSKNPEDRYATCQEFVEHLRKSGQSQPVEASAAMAAAHAERPFPTTPRTIGARGALGPVKTANPNFSVEDEFLNTPPAKPIAAKVIDAKELPGPSDSPTPASADSGRPSAARQRPGAPELPGMIQPSLIIGLGQLGIDALTQFRERLDTELGAVDAAPQIRVLAIDTDPATIQGATAGKFQTALRTQDGFVARLQRPSQYLKTRGGKLPTDEWLNPKLLYRIPREQKGAGLRALGRLAFVDNYRAIAKRIESELLACASQDTPHDSAPACELGLRTLRPRVYIVTSLTGSTGSGMFLDVAYLARKLLNSHGHSDSDIIGVFFLPTVRHDQAFGAALANTYASLVELQHFCQSESCFTAQYETAGSAAKAERVTEVGPAFQRCILMHLPTNNGKRSAFDNTACTARVGDLLFRDIATELGGLADQARVEKFTGFTQRRAATELTLQSVGMYRLHWPRQALLGQGARWLCAQLVTRWMSKESREFAETLQQWTHERWDSLAMRPEHLIERFQEMCEHTLHQTPEQLLAEILAPLHKAMDSSGGGKGKPQALQLGPAVQCMEKLESVLGIPEEARSAKNVHGEPPLMESTLADIAQVVADECEQRLAELAVTLLEDPDYRLAGAEEALRQFSILVEKALSAQEILGVELNDKATQLIARIQQLTESNAPNGAKAHASQRAAIASQVLTANDLFELVRTYTKTRYHSLVLTHLNRLYVALRGHLSDQIREVGFCRQRLGELLGLVQPVANPSSSLPVGGAQGQEHERVLFPAGCSDLKTAIGKFKQEITIENQLEFDRRVQVWITANYNALLHVCMGTSAQVRTIAPALLHEAEKFLKERLDGASVAEMYLLEQQSRFSNGADDLVIDDFERCLDDATPDVGRIQEHCDISLITFPNDKHGRYLQDLVNQRIPGAKAVLTERLDEIVFYHEALNIRWKDLDQLGPTAMEAYHQRLQADPSSLHAREDLAAFQSAPVA